MIKEGILYWIRNNIVLGIVMKYYTEIIEMFNIEMLHYLKILQLITLIFLKIFYLNLELKFV